MKKTTFISFFVVLLIGFAGCDTGLLSRGISPPSWIVGSWADEFQINSWTFSADNAVFSSDFVSFDFKEIGKTDGVSVTDTETNTKYTIVTKADGETAGSYTFEKVSDTVVNYSVTTGGMTVGPVVLLKSM